MIRWIVLCALMLVLSVPALADTAAGIAAYERGDYKAALELLKPEAENGDAAAQVKYGLIFAKALGVPRNPGEAVIWFRKAAEQGNAEAQYALGVAYDIGDVGQPNPQEAAAWYRKSADQGYARAQYNLGHMLLNGAIAGSPEEGAAWTLKAAEQDMADAMYLYGNSSMAGRGVEQNLLCARYWLTRAVAKGASKAQENLVRVEQAIAEIDIGNQARPAGGDGSTMARAISFPGVEKGHDGVAAEGRVIARFFPGWRKGAQALLQGDDGRVYDAITVTRDGKEKVIYFDVTEWFGVL